MKTTKYGKGKRDVIFATWNVLSLNREGAFKNLKEVMKNYKVSIAALQEVRWKGADIMDSRDYTIFYSGGNRKQLGTGFMVASNLKQTVLGFKPVNERLCSLRLKFGLFNVTVLCAHAPTEDSSEDMKDEFYALLDKEYEAAPRHDVKIVLGDMNAKVGREEVFRPAIGHHSAHSECNENGLRLVDYAIDHDMTISSTYFPRKNIHKVTWKSPDGVTENQIDHVLIDRRHGSDVIDVKTRRGADADSDHYLVLMKYRQRISRVRMVQGKKSEKLDVQTLSRDDNVKVNYRRIVSEKLKGREQELQGAAVTQQWTVLQDVLNSAATEAVGFNKTGRRTEWYDDECHAAVLKRNVAREKTLQRRATRANTENFQQTRKDAKKVLRKKKRQWAKEKLEQIEEMQNKKEVRAMFQGTREIKKGFQPRSSFCKDKAGCMIGDEKGIMERWVEYFEDLLNDTEEMILEPRDQGSEDQMEGADEEETVPEVTLNEVKDAISLMRNNRAPGEDGIPAELFKYGGEEVMRSMYTLIRSIWESEQIPEDWNTAVICPIHKKNDKTVCSNYRGISLLNVAYKIFSKVLARRLEVYAERELGEYQCGFRRNRSTLDHILSLRLILEKCYEYNVSIHQLYIDYKEAYDSINRDKLRVVLEEMRVPRKIINLVFITLCSTRARVKIQGQLTRKFEVRKGLRQGDATSTTLFNLCLEHVIRRIPLNAQGTIYTRSLQYMAFADDVVLLGRNSRTLVEALQHMSEGSRHLGLQINREKTKFMVSTRDKGRFQGVRDLEGEREKYERVVQFKYLGALMTEDNDVSVEIKARLAAGNKCYYAFNKLLKSSSLSRRLKLTVYRVIIRPVVLYGCEAWTLSGRDKNMLRVWERKVLRKIFRAICEAGEWRIRTNQEVYHLYEKIDLVAEAKKRRLRYLGHVVRMEGERVPKKALDQQPGGRRKPGRPRKRWIDDVREDVQALGIRNWRRCAVDKEEWAKAVGEARVLHGL